jgi:CxxC motif-containing protein (DUF1111 family)
MMRSWITLVEAVGIPPYMLGLPMWALNENILDQIEAICLAHSEENDDDGVGQSVATVLEDVQRMRLYLRRGTWKGVQPPVR